MLKRGRRHAPRSLDSALVRAVSNRAERTVRLPLALPLASVYHRRLALPLGRTLEV